jgi:hypothetical protein
MGQRHVRKSRQNLYSIQEPSLKILPEKDGNQLRFVICCSTLDGTNPFVFSAASSTRQKR